MNKFLLCILTTLVFAGCDRPEAEDATPAPITRPKTPVPTATPQAGSWMWKDPKGTPKNADPLSISDDPFAHKAKK